ncbi:hypothetical protein [Nostoc sp.]|uniref:hypothetical protein n=1 Tax=Nostoc sp. TaxID=1180 RepID=UPI002FF60941
MAGTINTSHPPSAELLGSLDKKLELAWDIAETISQTSTSLRSILAHLYSKLGVFNFPSRQSWRISKGREDKFNIENLRIFF